MFFMNRKNLEARKRLLFMKVLTNNFNKHKKNSLEIIDHLERQWNEFKRK